QVTDIRRLLEPNIPQTRQILRKLLVGTLVCTAFEDGERRGYGFTGQGSYDPILPVPTLGVTPEGYDSITSWATLPFESCPWHPSSVRCPRCADRWTWVGGTREPDAPP